MGFAFAFADRIQFKWLISFQTQSSAWVRHVGGEATRKCSNFELFWRHSELPNRSTASFVGRVQVIQYNSRYSICCRSETADFRENCLDAGAVGFILFLPEFAAEGLGTMVWGANYCGFGWSARARLGDTLPSGDHLPRNEVQNGQIQFHQSLSRAEQSDFSAVQPVRRGVSFPCLGPWRYPPSLSLSFFRVSRMEDIAHICDSHLTDGFELGNDTTKPDIYNKLREIAPSFDEVLFFCRWRNEPTQCRKFFSEMWTSDGLCYTFNAIKPTDIYSKECVW